MAMREGLDFYYKIALIPLILAIVLELFDFNKILVTIVEVVIIYIALLYIYAGIVQIAGRLLGVFKKPFNSTFSAFVYAAIPVLLTIWLGSLVQYIAAIWSLIIVVFALANQQDISKLASFLFVIAPPIIIFGGLFVLGFLSGLSGVGSTQVHFTTQTTVIPITIAGNNSSILACDQQVKLYVGQNVSCGNYSVTLSATYANNHITLPISYKGTVLISYEFSQDMNMSIAQNLSSTSIDLLRLALINFSNNAQQDKKYAVIELNDSVESSTNPVQTSQLTVTSNITGGGYETIYYYDQAMPVYHGNYTCSSSSPECTYNIPTGSYILFKAYPDTGYEILGWECEGQDCAINDTLFSGFDGSTTINHNLKLTAEYSK